MTGSSDRPLSTTHNAHLSEHNRKRAIDREARQAEALRANLQRRKQQQRGWAEKNTAPSAEPQVSATPDTSGDDAL